MQLKQIIEIEWLAIAKLEDGSHPHEQSGVSDLFDDITRFGFATLRLLFGSRLFIELGVFHSSLSLSVTTAHQKNGAEKADTLLLNDRQVFVGRCGELRALLQLW
jgi:hypothetical protein